MTQEALIRQLQISCLGLDPIDPLRLLVDDVIEALAQTQEPVACAECERLKDALKRANGLAEHFERAWYLRGDEIEELQAPPPQRTWVGLTDDEIQPCGYEACQTDLELTSQLVVYFAKAIEAKLKELNT